jgi:hypothetical protein
VMCHRADRQARGNRPSFRGTGGTRWTTNAPNPRTPRRTPRARP